MKTKLQERRDRTWKVIPDEVHVNRALFLSAWNRLSYQQAGTNGVSELTNGRALVISLHNDRISLSCITLGNLHTLASQIIRQDGILVKLKDCSIMINH